MEGQTKRIIIECVFDETALMKEHNAATLVDAVKNAIAEIDFYDSGLSMTGYYLTDIAPGGRTYTRDDIVRIFEQRAAEKEKHNKISGETERRRNYHALNAYDFGATIAVETEPVKLNGIWYDRTYYSNGTVGLEMLSDELE